MVGMGGPSLVLYASAHDWGPGRFRAFLWSQFLLGLPVAIAVLLWGVGMHLAKWVGFGLLLSPVLWQGVKWATVRSSDWPRERLAAVVTVLLYCVAVASLLSPVLR
jgi:hypothetical protein